MKGWYERRPDAPQRLKITVEFPIEGKPAESRWASWTLRTDWPPTRVERSVWSSHPYARSIEITPAQEEV